MMGVICVAEKSAIERIRELDAERASLFEQAKEEALKKATDAITDLIALGLDYQLVKGARQARNERTRRNPGDREGRTLSNLRIPHHPAS